MWLSDFRIVTPDRVIDHGALRIENGLIAEIGETPVPGAAIDGGGLLMLPGFIDMHGDMVEREVEPRPGVPMPIELGLRDLDRKLAGAGITTAYAALSFSPNSTYGHVRSYAHTSAVMRAMRALADDLRIDHRIHARFEITFPKALEVIEELITEGTVDLVSLCDHTPGQGQYRDIEGHAARLARQKNIAHSDAVAQLEQRRAERTRTAEKLARNLRAISDLCHAHGIEMASHDDDTVAKVALMQGLGVAISEFPVTIEAARAAHAAGLATAMGAPNALRGESYSGNLSAREAWQAGVLDMLAADYHPSAMLPAVLALAGEGPGGLSAAAALATANPARALGLHDRGRIEVGLRADLVIADDTGVGHVRQTLRGGVPVYSDGTVRLRG